MSQLLLPTQDASYYLAAAHELYEQHLQGEESSSIFFLLKSLLEQALEALLSNEALYLNRSLSARIAYCQRKFNLSSVAIYYLHRIRVSTENLLTEEEEQPTLSTTFLPSLRAFLELVTKGWNQPFPSWVSSLPDYPVINRGVKQKIPEVRVIFLEWQPTTGYFICQTVSRGIEVPVKLEIPENMGMDEEKLAKKLWRGAEINLIDVEVLGEGAWHPKFWILESDFLLDVTLVADCYDNPILYLRKKFLSTSTTPAIMVGNIANHTLDTLLHAGDNNVPSFKEILIQTFKLYPLEYTLWGDETIKEIFEKASLDYQNITNVIKNDFPKLGVEINKVMLETAFISCRWGIQGRPDLLWQDKEGRYNIIELKSGKPPHSSPPLWPEHSVQAQLYHLLIRSVWGDSKAGQVTVFYSKLAEDSIRYDSSFLVHQKRILFQRNQILCLEYLFVEGAQGVKSVFDSLSIQDIESLKPYLQADLQSIIDNWKKFTELEKSYFAHFVSFIARENWAARLGRNGGGNEDSHSSTWLRSLAEKEQGGKILAYLQFDRMEPLGNEIRLFWKPSSKTLKHADFRVGDIVILYPQKKGGALKHQLYKGVLLQIEGDHIELKLRGSLQNKNIFNEFEYWCIEKDYMDNTINAMYKNLWHFMVYPSKAKELLFVNRLPKVGKNVTIPETIAGKLNDNQLQVLQRALAAEDYFLIQGPPGTGKTKIMLRALVEYLYHHTDQNILLLSYTNRAVDEICESLVAPEPIPFLRIGSEASARGAPYLLENQIKNYNSRQEIKKLIDSHRVFTSTVATINNKTILFNLKKFDTVIIDEASQLLEPQLLYVLTKVDKFILIGDEKQLPAVVVTSPELTHAECPLLHSIGLTNLRNSLFERLLHLSQQNNNIAHGMLLAQGRMHKVLQEFPSRFFYEGKLRIVDNQRQARPISDTILAQAQEKFPVLSHLTQSRLLYIPTVPYRSGRSKVNELEAQLVATLVGLIAQAYGNRFNPQKTVGVITPFRAQISCIFHYLEAIQTQLPSEVKQPLTRITVDTVERYQGGSREIIIISFALSAISLLPAIISRSLDLKIDRKLNVALTRAQEHLILIGNESILRKDSIYSELIAHIQESGGYIPLQHQELASYIPYLAR
ncbi:MAG: AAA domain-containing protein [Bacteroidia bacterium]|nr:AAA domain-containing protein [Bacteroidia bacterium]